MKIQRLNLDDATWEDALEFEPYESTIRVVLDDGTLFDLHMRSASSTIEVSTPRGLVTIRPRAANNVWLTSEDR